MEGVFNQDNGNAVCSLSQPIIPCLKGCNTRTSDIWKNVLEVSQHMGDLSLILKQRLYNCPEWESHMIAEIITEVGNSKSVVHLELESSKAFSRGALFFQSPSCLNMRNSALRVVLYSSRVSRSQPSIGRLAEPSARQLSTTTSCAATALPITAAGPPPSPPVPTSSQYGDRIDERRRKAELLKQGKEIRASESGKTSPLKKRFWKDVHVREVPEGYQIHLDSRPVRTPTKSILTIPRSKPHLAHAIAIEWDMLENVQQALKNYNIPMTSIAARVQDIIEAEEGGDKRIRVDIVTVMMRYLDTDTLLCWAPENASEDAASLDMQSTRTDSLRGLQIKTAQPIISYLKTSVWPGVELRPVLDENSIMPVQQSEVTTSVIRGWITGLPAYELAALERAVLAGKSLLVGTRLLIEWSEEFRDLQRSSGQRFGIEEAAEAASLEVKWQTGKWGEVEDSHDVDNEDIRRQLGSAILLISGHR